MATSEVLLFDRNGSLIAEVEPDLQFVNWRLNNVGTAKFSMAWSDPKCTKDNLRPGNRVLIRFDNGLPDWGGVIDFPRQREKGKITVTAYTAERLLDWRVTAKARYYDQAQPGYIFRTRIEEENAEYPTGVEIGNIYLGGTPRTLEDHYHDLLRRMRDLARLTGNDFAVLPEYSGGRVSFRAHWYERRGRDLRDSVWLLDGANVVSVSLDEQGPLANRVIVIGDGTTWGDDRPDAVKENNDSRGEYGYREYAEVQTVVDSATLEANAAALLEQMAWPRNRVTITVANRPPARFADYDIGDIVKAVLFVDSDEWYFEAPVRIIAREWYPDGICRLEVEEWTRS